MDKDVQKGKATQVRAIYHYLVLFATLMMVVGGGVGVFMSLADIIFPEPHYQTFDEYREYKRYQMSSPLSDGNTEPVEISDEELRSNYEEVLEISKERQLIVTKKRLLKSFGWLLIPFPVFIYFQRRTSKKQTKKER